jgi:ABC-type Na+ transport system ATPase subunit NatA
MLTTLLPIDSGSAAIAGINVKKKPERSENYRYVSH